MIETALTPVATAPSATRLRQGAQDMEASFLAQIPKYAGYGDARESIGGGVGEDQFRSVLRAAQAKAMVQSGGIGLAESRFNALKESRDVTDFE